MREVTSVGLAQKAHSYRIDAGVDVDEIVGEGLKELHRGASEKFDTFFIITEVYIK